MNRSSSNEALELSNDLLADMELGELALSNCFMKGCRLARLLGDTDMLQVFQWEVSGYPSKPGGIPPNVWALAKKAKRVYEVKDKKSGAISEKCYTSSIEGLETLKSTSQTRLKLTEQKSVSVSSANPNQYVHPPYVNLPERNNAEVAINKTSEQIASRRSFLYEYVLKRHMELRVSSPAEDIFTAHRQKIDDLLGRFIPEELVKIDSIAENLNSENSEDWANAAHTCRRLLQGLADKIYPARDDLKKDGKLIKLGPDNYINRLVCYCESNSSSGTFNSLIGSHLSFIGDRLDSIFNGAQKGSHANLSLDESRRIVIFTYICVGDILELAESDGKPEAVLE